MGISFEGLRRKAICQAYIQDYSGCVATYEKFLQYPEARVTQTWVNKATCLAMQHDFDGCIEAAEQGVALDGNNQDAQKMHDNCLHGKENPEEFEWKIFFKE